MDNPYTTWSPLPKRAPLAWPNGAPLALCVLVSLEHLEWFPAAGSFIPPYSVGYGPYPRLFQLTGVAQYEYGNRVGVFRVMDVLEKHGIRATVGIDSALARANPYLTRACAAKEWEFIAHGRAYSQMITEEMAKEAEYAYIAETINELELATGSRPTGWLGADYWRVDQYGRVVSRAGTSVRL